MKCCKLPVCCPAEIKSCSAGWLQVCMQSSHTSYAIFGPPVASLSQDRWGGLPTLSAEEEKKNTVSSNYSYFYNRVFSQRQLILMSRRYLSLCAEVAQLQAGWPVFRFCIHSVLLLCYSVFSWCIWEAKKWSLQFVRWFPNLLLHYFLTHVFVI